MTIFKTRQKSIAFVLVMAVVFSVAAPILLLPRKTDAQCTVMVAASSPQTKNNTQNKFYQAIDKAYQKGGLTQATITAAKLVWQEKWEMMKAATSVLMNLLLHQILAMLTNDIVNWIQDGTTPRFLKEGIGDYLKEAADNAAGNFIDQYLGGGWLCEPFELDIKIALLDVSTFETEAKCSISDIVDNIEDFYNDFSKGGWKGWIELSKPQNTFYGAYLLAQDAKAGVEKEAKKEMETDAEAGRGFLSIKDCKWYDANNILVEEQKNVRGVPKLPEKCKFKVGEESTITPPCKSKCETKTPAAIVNEMINKASTGYYDRINMAIANIMGKDSPYQVYVQALASALTNRIIKEGLAFVKGDEPAPKYGDTGASASIPQIVDPETVIQGKNDSAALIGNLNTLKGNLENELLKAQQDNLAVLGVIKSTYLEIIPILNNVTTACASTPPYTGYVTWANNNIDGINNSIIPSLDSRINQMQTVDILATLETVNKINTSIVSIQNYVNKADAWLAIYEQVSGQQDSLELSAAETEMNGAENQAVKDIQSVLKEIVGSYASTDITELNQEIFNTNIIIVTRAIDLEKEKGESAWPGVGTLYAELEAAQGLKDNATDKWNTCLSYTPPDWGW